MADTSIEWTDKVWNPTRGCSLISPGCTNCYAMRMAHRFSGKGQPYEGLTRLGANGPIWTGEVRPAPGMLEAPLEWRKPAKVFVDSMSDLFHDAVTDEHIDRVFGVMGLSEDMGRGHVFQILTKRAERMRDYLRSRAYKAWNSRRLGQEAFPPRNVWLGVSVEDVKRKDRIVLLRQTPAVVRFLSLEPLLEDLGEIDLAGIHWVIVGGESGPHARPVHPQWVRALRDQCVASGVSFFFKQWGGVRKKDAGRTLDGREWSEIPK